MLVISYNTRTAVILWPYRDMTDIVNLHIILDQLTTNLIRMFRRCKV